MIKDLDPSHPMTPVNRCSAVKYAILKKWDFLNFFFQIFAGYKNAPIQGLIMAKAWKICLNICMNELGKQKKVHILSDLYDIKKSLKTHAIPFHPHKVWISKNPFLVNRSKWNELMEKTYSPNFMFLNREIWVGLLSQSSQSGHSILYK